MPDQCPYPGMSKVQFLSILESTASLLLPIAGKFLGHNVPVSLTGHLPFDTSYSTILVENFNQEPVITDRVLP